jgi:serine/threonine protein kinase
MVTSWMINGLLSEYLKSEEEYDQMDLVKGVANGVAYLHSKKIVHADLRASSVLVDELGNARLADPGLLSILSNSPLIVTGMMNAPYRWMAPELLKNSSTKANFKTDVYSFTMTSLEIFTAAQPFQGLQDALVPGQVLENQRPNKPNDVALALWALWADGWNGDPAERPDMANYVQRLSPLS